MKGSKEHKRYLQKYRDDLKAIHYDDLYLMRLELCKKKFNRRETNRIERYEYEHS